MRTRPSRQLDEGFTLVELLVVLVIIAILSAIAIPSFLRHQNKGKRAAAISDMKNAASAVESYASERGDNYLQADGLNETSPELDAEGYNNTDWVRLEITATKFTFCIEGMHEQFPEAEFVYRSTTGVVDIGAVGGNPCG